MNKVWIFLVVLMGLMVSSEVLEAQNNRRNSRNNTTVTGNNDLQRGGFKLSDRLFVGGNFWGNLGNGGRSFLEISPLLGYRITEKFAAGAGIVYQFYGSNTTSASNRTTVLGWRALARYDIFQNLFAQTEFERLNYKSGGLEQVVRRWPIGAGFQQRIGGGGAGRLRGTAVIMRDLLWDENASPFDSPWIIRFGVNVGL